MSDLSISELAEKHLPGDYVIERRKFTDGDRRDIAKHHVGYGELGTYTTYRLWKQLGELWVEYYEGDVLRDRRIHQYELQERVV